MIVYARVLTNAYGSVYLTHMNNTTLTFDRMPTNTQRPMLGTPSPCVDLAGIYRGSSIVGQLGRCATGEYAITVGTNDQAHIFATRAEARAFVNAL